MHNSDSDDHNIDFGDYFEEFQTGASPGDVSYKICPDCKGKGALLLLYSIVDCETCNGSGKIDS